ncbi:MAG: ribbon-helix-helix domain-containing protein [Planctomycetota bacterium]|nr:ribbon-helix-helix domain-containing protein [Planctomycetota bacterium]
MSTAKVAITMNEDLLRRLDSLVRSRLFENRSRAIQEAVSEKIARLERGRLARECAKLDPAFEQAMAEEGMSAEVAEWPEY